MLDLLIALLAKLGYATELAPEGHILSATHPLGRVLLFVGDYVDRGPRPLAVLRSVLSLMKTGPHVGIRGNHEDFLKSWLTGRVQAGFFYPGFEPTYDDLGALSDEQKAGLLSEVESLPFEILASRVPGAPPVLVVTHAGIHRADVGRSSPDLMDSLLLGRSSPHTRALLGNMDVGSPGSGSWVADWAFATEGPYCVSGHVPLPRPLIRNRFVIIDTGAVYEGGRLSAFRYPEISVSSVGREDLVREALALPSA